MPGVAKPGLIGRTWDIISGAHIPSWAPPALITAAAMPILAHELGAPARKKEEEKKLLEIIAARRAQMTGYRGYPQQAQPKMASLERLDAVQAFLKKDI